MPPTTLPPPPSRPTVLRCCRTEADPRQHHRSQRGRTVIPDSFADTARRLRVADGRSLRTIAAAIHLDPGMLSRIETGKRPPTEQVAAALDAVLDANGTLIALAREQNPTPLDASAEESLALAEWLSTDDHSSVTIDSLTTEIATLSTRYARHGPRGLTAELDAVRARIRRALRSGPPPRRARDLLVLAAATTDLLAQLSSDLAHPSAALQHAHAAHTLAVRAEHEPLQVWTLGTQALITETHTGPWAALTVVHQARPSTGGVHRVRHALLRARCAAGSGDRVLASTAIEDALRTAGPDDSLTRFGAAFQFPPARVAAYMSSIHLLTGDHRHGRAWARCAVESYRWTPTTLGHYLDDAHAHIDIALTHIADSDPDAACQVLRDLLELEASQVVSPLEMRLRLVCDALSGFGREHRRMISDLLDRRLPNKPR
ncbi:helix-turn-helix domain-containing protein [Nocardia takedensis]